MAKKIWGQVRLWYDTNNPGVSETSVESFDFWCNTSTGQFFQCSDPTVGAQVWQLTSITASTAINHGVMLGRGSSASLAALAVGATGTVLTGVTGADAAFSATPGVTSITFGAGSALSVYSEAQTFTPTISGGTAAGAGTYTTQAGFYTRIGNLICVQATIIWTNHTGTGDMLLTALPATIKNTASYVPIGSIQIQSVTLPANTIQVMVSGTLNTTQAALNAVIDNAAISPVQMDTSGTINFTLMYQI